MPLLSSRFTPPPPPRSHTTTHIRAHAHHAPLCSPLPLRRQDKGTFALKAVELGRIFSHNFADPAATKGVELYHDSSKVAGARPGEGATGKTLRVRRGAACAARAALWHAHTCYS